MKFHCLLLAMAVLLTALLPGCRSTPKDDDISAPPAWATDAVWYQVFVERFANGDPSNDPDTSAIAVPALGQHAPAGWQISDWDGDWYERDAWADAEKPFHETLQWRRYGGDLQGLMDKLDYLQDLGITALYLNPINHAPSLHKYDASAWHHVDAHFGPDPAGDLAIMAAEDPANPDTWQWTAADKLFLRLVDEVHRRGMRIIVDFSWNHTGTRFRAWEDVLSLQQRSAFKDWYAIKTFDDSATAANEFDYHGWLNIRSLPEIRKTDITTERRIGHPYEGDINPEAKAHIYAVTGRWLAPDGDTTKGIDGFRLDVADHIGLGFWRDWRRHVRSIRREALLVGEVWWAQWPDELMDPVPYTNGDVFDAIMFYQAYRPAKYFFSKSDYAIDARQLRDSLSGLWNRLRPETVAALMNVSSTHDAPRLLTCFANPGKYKYHALPHEDSAYFTGRPDADTYRRVRLYLMHLFTIPGAPQVWNGEEMGMWGADDPDCRRPLWWPERNIRPQRQSPLTARAARFDPAGFDSTHFNWYRRLIHIRRNHPALRRGTLEWLVSEGRHLAYRRHLDEDDIVVLFNLGDGPENFALPEQAEYENLLSGEKQETDMWMLPAGTGVILRRH